MLLFTYQYNTNKLGSQLLHRIMGHQTKENTKPWHGCVFLASDSRWVLSLFPDSEPTHERAQKTPALCPCEKWL